MTTVFSQEYLGEKLTYTLGNRLSKQELQSCLASMEIVQPPVAKQFWQSAEMNAGIYVILAGKVRLSDSSDDLITTLSAWSSFGEMTLFPEENFNHYSARSSQNLELGYLKPEVLQGLMNKYPHIRDRLFSRAEIWDLLLWCRQNSGFPGHPAQFHAMLKALSFFERHNLEIGSVNTQFPDSHLWLLYKGQLLHSQGNSLTPGQISTEPNQGHWQAIQPTIAYILKSSNWLKAREHCPALGSFVPEPEHQNTSTLNQTEWESKHKSDSNPDKRPRQKPITKVIPFPQREPESKAKQNKTLPYFPSPKVKMGHWWQRLSKRYPFYAQQSGADCGSACLVMIGKYWGKHFSVNRLRDMTNVNRSGASLRALAAVGENLGFATRPVKATFDKFAEQSLPAIAHWEGNHYIVVYQITKKRVIVGDPAIGQRSLTRSQFNAGWTGYALLLQPTELLKETKNETANFWKFFELVKPHYSILVEVFLASVLMQLFGLVTPVFTQLLLDRVLVQRSIPTLNAVGMGMIVFGLFGIAMNGVRQYLLDHTANRVSISLLVGFIKHTFRLPLAYFESRYVGDIVSRIQENQKIQRFLTGETLSIMLDMLTLVIYLSMMFWYSWRMTLFVLLTVPPFFILALASTNILRRISREVFNAGAKENSYLIESLTGIRTVRSLAIEQTVRWRWEELLNDLVKKGFNAQVIGNRLRIVSGVIQTFVNASLMWFGAWQVIEGQLTMGQLVAFNMLVGNVLSPFQRLSMLWNGLQEIIISTERINDVLEAEPEEDLQNKPRKPLGRLNGRICFQNVTFRYHAETETNVLENINFEIQPEQMVAVVGRSGSGKTTLSKLILGLYPPTDGKVLIDGFDINTISLRSLRSQIGVVDQDTFLFGGTIRENIGIAHPEASVEEITQAAKLAGADEFIQQLPMGYESQIGESGGMLSGGQRQRLAIARALIGNPRLLLFDEATSHLDSESERIIQNNLKTILQGRTSVIIAHRLSTVRNADLILVLDRGVLVESGTHDELIAKQGHYYYLNQQQLAQVV
ncbi:ABC transporter transmembrane domain-containing protein [Nodularia spumigena CS-584]|jgi:HlyB family type I secretion system ABC transporter|uniref:ABC transporter transmembrane domain-containing protein n=1 Tax=Nodularia spumigena UHCC 0060 TaxID=3110300 RepID=A0ABU5UTR6_NODSP|nr:ABC transporter transmembrane domain-containing protein [Nodularia spumigena]AHJ28352.1 ABC transporter ATP-binding protein [Nodularia spumigena CCY9414]EAW45333.1 Cyclic nucleotide-regulated ABC bacteriocin/lantibiotic exporter [Nodularia spumigena CCY9414]MDB9381564.1 ABC transporter transmembrane domain-containing protein [Nodularia spumigena CS-584]MEA5526593.1 ABC transporter transmembrane domain-containing protein [Nodularia spumigena UHCC 0143]MEA5609703.1 ABC transporter transmembra